MKRKEKLIQFLDLIDEKIGIGLGIDYNEIKETDIDNIIKEFHDTFLIEFDYFSILNKINENNQKSYLELLNEI